MTATINSITDSSEKNDQTIDLTDMDIFARGVPHEKFQILRKESPVYWNEEADPEPGFWAITKYDDIVTISRESETFTSTRVPTSHTRGL